MLEPTPQVQTKMTLGWLIEFRSSRSVVLTTFLNCAGTGVVPYGGDYSVPTYRVAGPLCFINGVVRISVMQSTYMTIPGVCIPDHRRIFDQHVQGQRTFRMDV
jgi:hypothetical protein